MRSGLGAARGARTVQRRDAYTAARAMSNMLTVLPLRA